MSVGENIKKLRMERGVPVPRLAAMAGVSAPDVFMWEKNRLAPTPEQIEACARALGVEIVDIAGQEEHDGAEGDIFDAGLVARTYAMIRGSVDRADALELTSVRAMLEESLALVAARLSKVSRKGDAR